MKLKKLQVTTRYDVILKFLKLIFKARHQLTLQKNVEKKGLRLISRFEAENTMKFWIYLDKKSLFFVC